MTIVDDTPPPPPTLSEAIEALEIGQSLLAPKGKMSTLRTLASRISRRHPHRRFKCGDSIHGPRVWRLPDDAL